MKTIIEKDGKLWCTEWKENEQPEDRGDVDFHHVKYDREYYLHSQPSTELHPDHQEWGREHLYQPVEDDQLQYDYKCDLKDGCCMHDLEKNRDEDKMKFCSNSYKVALPKQPVEVKRKTAKELLAEQKREEEEMVSKLSPASAPGEKGGSYEGVLKLLHKRIKKYELSKNDTIDVSDKEKWGIKIRVTNEIIDILKTYTSAPAQEDWVSEDLLLKMIPTISNAVLEWFKSDNVIVKDLNTGNEIYNAEITTIEKPESLYENYIKPSLKNIGITLTRK